MKGENMNFNIIADGGAVTKHTGANTRDSIILGLNTPYIDGFKFKLYKTKDNEIISLSDDIYQLILEHINRIDEIPLHTFLAYNIGTKVQHQQILTLKEILKIFHTYQKDLVLEFMDHQEDNALYTDLILLELRKYPNINYYLETKNQEIFEYLTSSNLSYPIGLVVREDSLENYNIDASFYDIATELLRVVNIRDRIRDGKFIMIDQVNFEETFDLIYQEYQDIFPYIFIITSKISNINQDVNFPNTRFSNIK